MKTAVLVSGRGTNMQALLAEAAKPGAPFEVMVVLCDRLGAEAIKHAEAAGVASVVITSHDASSRSRQEKMFDDALREAEAEYICLAGFMRILEPAFVARWPDRIINIHPSLLPSYPGLNTHARAIADGTRIHGCTVHFVRPEVDEGPVIAQVAVPVLPDDDPETLAARVLVAEHRLYPKVVRWIAEGRVELKDGRVEIRDAEWPDDGMDVPF